MKLTLSLIVLLLLVSCAPPSMQTHEERMDAIWLRAIAAASERAYYRGYLAAKRGLPITDPVEGFSAVTNELTQHFAR